MIKKYVAVALCSIHAFGGGSVDVPVSEPVVIPEQAHSDRSDSDALIYLSDLYIGVGAGLASLEVSNSLSETLEAKSLSLILGVSLSRYFAIEGRYSQSLGDATYNRVGVQEDIDSTYSNLAVYLKATYPVKKFEPYLLVGYGESTFSNIEGYDRKEAGLQYGAGIRYVASRHWSFFADYIRAYDGKGYDGRARLEDVRLDHWTLGLFYRF